MSHYNCIICTYLQTQRRNVGNASHGDNSDSLTTPGPLQRSASTGSITSTGIPTNITGVRIIIMPLSPLFLLSLEVS